MKPKVFVSRAIPEAGLSRVRHETDATINTDERVLSKAELMAGVQGAEGLICQLTDRVDAEVIAAAPKLRVISNYAVGFNNIDIDAATARRIVVTNTPGVLTEATADLAWALLLAIARRVVEGDDFMRSGRYQAWAPQLLLGGEVYGKRLGIVGFGRIGQAVARRAKGFAMDVVYYSRHPKPEVERELGARRVEFDELISTSDFVSLHCALAPETEHLIDAAALARMKPTAYLINTARGPVIDESALVRALQERRIAGAALDVYEDEPRMAPGLAELDNVVLLPHLGSATTQARARMSEIVAGDLLAALAGERPAHVVNPKAWD